MRDRYRRLHLTADNQLFLSSHPPEAVSDLRMTSLASSRVIWKAPWAKESTFQRLSTGVFLRDRICPGLRDKRWLHHLPYTYYISRMHRHICFFFSVSDWSLQAKWQVTRGWPWPWLSTQALASMEGRYRSMRAKIKSPNYRRGVWP